MRNLLSLAILLALPAAASASDEGCMVSFAGAQQNVCTGAITGAVSNIDRLQSLAAMENSSLRLIKFDGPILLEQRKAIEAAGARIVDYAPYYAYIVRMPATLDHEIRQIEGVVWSGPFMPALKIDPNVYNEIKHGGIVEGLGIEMLEISVDTQDGQAGIQSSLSTIAGLKAAQVINVAGENHVRAGFDLSRLVTTIEQLALRDDVVSIGFRKPKRLLNSQGHWLHQSNQNSPQPQMPIWNQGVYGCGQIVGELDTGLYMDNVAFKDASQPLAFDKCSNGSSCAPIAAPNFNARKVVAYYKWSGLSGSTWDDDHGHGTHVAGSIIGNNNVANPGTDCVNFTTPGGSTDLDGMAPGAKLVMQESGGNLAYLNNHGGTIYHAADVAYQNGARIHSNSWGGSCTNQFGQCVSGCTVTYDEESRDSDRLMEDREDLLLVFAAGNDATACSNGNNVGSPGNAKNVLSIGATNRGSAANAMASFSSRGPALDSRTKPDLAAQGSSIMSADRNASGTRSMSGTSMATPTAAGLAALVRDYLARGFYPSGEKTPADAITTPSGALVKAILTAGAFKMTGSGAGANPGQAQGFGRILLDDSLYFDADPKKLFIHDDPDGLATGGVESHSLAVSAGEPLTIVLTWTDVAGAVGASPATVNSLRLEVQAPNGDVWTQKLPGGFNVNNANPTQGTSTTNYDNLNNLHRIRFDTPAAGTYEIRVRGINVPDGPQKFALAASGNFDLSTDPNFSLTATPNALAICAGTPAEYDIGVRSRYGFTDPVTLSASGQPGASTATFSTNPVTPTDPAAISQLSIGNTSGLARGSYSLDISGTSAGVTPLSRAIAATMNVSVGIPASPTLSLPVNGETDVLRQPALSWSDDVAAEGYTIEVATDSGFSTIIATGTSATNSWTPSTPLAPMTTYYWRVKADSICGDSGLSTTFSFTTGVTFPEPYCEVTFPSGVEPITRVTISGINNPSALSGGLPHEDFLGVVGGLVEPGQSYTMSVEGNTAGSYTNRINAFIDWNRNGVFDSGEAYTIGNISSSTGNDGKKATASIAVPATVTPGPVRMRVLKKYNAVAPACNSAGYGQAEDYTLMVNISGPSYNVGGTVSNAIGPGLLLKLNGGADHAVSDGAYTFPNPVPDGLGYAVTVSASPAAQSCSVANGSGTINGADVTNVDVSCTTLPTYTVGGTVAGLTGSGLVLKLNGGDDEAINADGPFTFSDGLVNNATYNVTIGSQPVLQTCSVANGSGTMGAADVTNVEVNCVDRPPVPYTIGGRVRGMTVPGLILQLNGGVTHTQNGNGTYAFVPGLPEGDSYEVTVHTQPSGVRCEVSNAAGTMPDANVTDVDVDCDVLEDPIFKDGFES